MATKKKTTSKKISNKVQQIIQTDVFKSIAIASVLLNVLFLVTVVVLTNVLTNTSTFDRKLYISARERYCDNSEVLKSRSEELGSKKAALMERQVDCNGKDFSPFYKEALEKYKAHSEQN
jgi:hypothetical protein